MDIRIANRLTLDTDHVYQMYTQLYANNISQLKACMLLFTLPQIMLMQCAVYEYHVYRNLGNFHVKIIHVINIHFD